MVKVAIGKCHFPKNNFHFNKSEESKFREKAVTVKLANINLMFRSFKAISLLS